MLPPWSRYCCPFLFMHANKKKRNISFFSAKILFKMRFISGQYKRPWTWAQFLCGDISPATLHKKKLLTAWFSSASVHFTNCWRKIPRKSKGNITQNGFASEIYKLHSLPLFLDILIKFVWKLWENLAMKKMKVGVLLAKPLYIIKLPRYQENIE